MVTNYDLPFNGWRPRPHQENLWKYLEHGGKRAMAVWHRRAGKDEICLHHAACSMGERPGNYWHCLPEYNQGRKAIWTAINAHTGRRRIDEAFPLALRETTSDNEMFIRFRNGSTWQVVGSDRYDATVGAGVAGIVYSEFALSNPSAWAYHRPMLEENNGWAAFITTPRGRNHAYEMARFAKTSPGWFFELLTVEQTGQLTEQQLDETLQEYQALYGEDAGKAQFLQEYYCSWEGQQLGAYYGGEMAAVRREGRIMEFDALPDVPVHRAWDLGVDNATSIWFWQPCGAQILILDHYAASGVGLDHYHEEIVKRYDRYGWKHGTDYVPHDAKVKELGSGRTRVETMQALGLAPQLVTDARLEDGINAVRRTLPLCVFHQRTEQTGVSALEQYRREWDDTRKCFKPTPYKDWTSDPCDAFRYLSQAWRPPAPRRPRVALPSGWAIPPVVEQQRHKAARL